MIVLGIDPSLTSCGIGCIDDTLTILNSSVIKPGKRRGAERLDYIIDRIQTIGNTTKPDLVVLEGYSYNSVGRSYDLGELGGVIRLYLYQNNLDTIIVPPLQLKKFWLNTGYLSRNELKKEIVEKINKTFNTFFSEKKADIAEALGLAYIGLALYDKVPLHTRKQREVIHSLQQK